MSTPVPDATPTLGAGATLRMRVEIPAEFTELAVWGLPPSDDAGAFDQSMLTVFIDGAPAERLRSNEFRLPSGARTIDVVLAADAPSPVPVRVSAINPNARCRECPA